ncbi:MAG TPA: response regulator transcription factor [Asticcacaulis sp.]|nr:response regulator transcription factor [Asticcacaulis sp.]
MPRLLLIDDQPVFCSGFTATCAELRPHFDITVATTLSEALTLFEAGRRFHCVVIDLAKPDGSDLTALEALAGPSDSAPRLVVSARDDCATRLRAERLGAAGFLSKSLASADMMAAIDRVLDGGTFFDDVRPGPLAHADVLTPRQLEVLELLGRGCANKEIETKLGVADRTVRAHVTEIFKVLGVQSRVRAVVEARRRGLIP